MYFKYLNIKYKTYLYIHFAILHLYTLIFILKFSICVFEQKNDYFLILLMFFLTNSNIKKIEYSYFFLILR